MNYQHYLYDLCSECHEMIKDFPIDTTLTWKFTNNKLLITHEWLMICKGNISEPSCAFRYEEDLVIDKNHLNSDLYALLDEYKEYQIQNLKNELPINEKQKGKQKYERTNR